MKTGSTLTGYCPNCEAEQALEHIRKRETVTVRGEKIAVQAAYFRCRVCGDEFEEPGARDEVAEAYALYREKTGLMQPEEIKRLREGYGLTQAELAKVLGFGAVTLSRYENGMLQTVAQDRMLQMLRDPRAFWTLCRQSAEAGEISGATLQRVREKSLPGLSVEMSLDPAVQMALAHGSDHLSGGRPFDSEKFRNVVLFLCEKPRWKTTMNKLLFYADFESHRQCGHSITGARYVHATFGPCPDKYEALFAWLVDRKDITISERSVGKHLGDEIQALRKPNTGIFSNRELHVLRTVRGRLGRRTASDLSNLSHDEQGYRETQDGELISYRYAKSLRG